MGTTSARTLLYGTVHVFSAGHHAAKLCFTLGADTASPPTLAAAMTCSVCGVICTLLEHWTAHLAGRKHAAQLKRQTANSKKQAFNRSGRRNTPKRALRHSLTGPAATPPPPAHTDAAALPAQLAGWSPSRCLLTARDDEYSAVVLLLIRFVFQAKS